MTLDHAVFNNIFRTPIDFFFFNILDSKYTQTSRCFISNDHWKYEQFHNSFPPLKYYYTIKVTDRIIVVSVKRLRTCVYLLYNAIMYTQSWTGSDSDFGDLNLRFFYSPLKRRRRYIIRYAHL